MTEIAVQWLPMLAALVGAAAAGGLVAGLLGVGGGIIIVPVLDVALELAGVSPAVALHIAVATSMATIVPTSISTSPQTTAKYSRQIVVLGSANYLPFMQLPAHARR